MKQILKTTKPEADTFPAFTLHLTERGNCSILLECQNLLSKLCQSINKSINSRFVLVIRTPCILSAQSDFFTFSDFK